MTEIRKSLLHLVESSARHMWLEKLIVVLSDSDFQQELITLSQPGEINSYLKDKIPNYSANSKIMLFRFCTVFIKIIKYLNQNPKAVLLVQGHLPAFIGSVACKIKRIPYCYIHHNQPLYFELLREKKPIRGFIHSKIYLFYIRNAQVIQSLSSDVTQQLIQKNVDQARIIELGPGIDFKEYELKLHTSPEVAPLKTGPTILMVGRMAWEKNYEIAIEAMAYVLRDYPNCKMLIAGDGPLKKNLSELVSKLGLDHKVKFLGVVKNVPALMSKVDLFLHTAFTESYGQIYIEAALVDLPILTFPKGLASDQDFLNLAHITLLRHREPSSISKAIIEHIRSPILNRRAFSENFILYSRHNEEFVFSKISQYLQLVTQIKETK